MLVRIQYLNQTLYGLKKLLTFNASEAADFIFRSTPTRLDIAQAYVAVKANDHLKYLVSSLHRAQLRPWHNNGRTVICRIHGLRATRISYPSEGRVRPLIICSSREPQMQLQGGMVLDLCWLEYCLVITYVIASSI